MRCLAAIALGAIVAGCLARRPPSELPMAAAATLEMPDGLRATGTRRGLDYASDWIVLHEPRLGSVTDVVLSPRIEVVGTWGAWQAGRDGEPSRWIAFDHPSDGTQPADMRSCLEPGVPPVAYFDRGGNWHPVGIFDGAGKVLWRSRRVPAPNRLAIGDLERDGRLDAVVGFNAAGGLARLSASGETIWAVTERNVWSVELMDVDGDDQLEIMDAPRATS